MQVRKSPDMDRTKKSIKTYKTYVGILARFFYISFLKMEALNSPMKKMAIDQENAEKENLAPPSSKLLEKQKEEPSEKFLVPKIVPEVENKVRK